jgi:hypothetical protein
MCIDIILRNPLAVCKVEGINVRWRAAISRNLDKDILLLLFPYSLSLILLANCLKNRYQTLLHLTTKSVSMSNNRIAFHAYIVTQVCLAVIIHIDMNPNGIHSSKIRHIAKQLKSNFFD